MNNEGIDQVARDKATEAKSLIDAHIASCIVHYKRFDDGFNRNDTDHSNINKKIDSLADEARTRWRWSITTLLAVAGLIAGLVTWLKSP